MWAFETMSYRSTGAMSTTTGDPLAAARTAVARLEWERGFELFEEADASVELVPEDLELMAEAAWWAMHADDAIEALERERALGDASLARGRYRVVPR